jgi:hypothetical protein
VLAGLKPRDRQQCPGGEWVWGGTLPFTGFELVLIVGGALCLLAIGAGLRRVSRARS